METERALTIRITGMIDFHAAEHAVSRIRAAMRTFPGDLVVELAEDAAINSAEFLAFLATAAKFLKSKNRDLTLQVSEEKNEALLRMTRLDEYMKVRKN